MKTVKGNKRSLREDSYEDFEYYLHAQLYTFNEDLELNHLVEDFVESDAKNGRKPYAYNIIGLSDMGEVAVIDKDLNLQRLLKHAGLYTCGGDWEGSTRMSYKNAEREFDSFLEFLRTNRNWVNSPVIYGIYDNKEGKFYFNAYCARNKEEFKQLLIKRTGDLQGEYDRVLVSTAEAIEKAFPGLSRASRKVINDWFDYIPTVKNFKNEQEFIDFIVDDIKYTLADLLKSSKRRDDSDVQNLVRELASLGYISKEWLKRIPSEEEIYMESRVRKSRRLKESFENVLDRYLPAHGEGDNMAEQAVTAVNKIEYKWYNDGDVYDNTYNMEGWANDLSSYANWLHHYVPGAAEVLEGIRSVRTDTEYEALIEKLKSVVYSEAVLSQLEAEAAIDSIYECDGPYKFEDCTCPECGIKCSQDELDNYGSCYDCYQNGDDYYDDYDDEDEDY